MNGKREPLSALHGKWKGHQRDEEPRSKMGPVHELNVGFWSKLGGPKSVGPRPEKSWPQTEKSWPQSWPQPEKSWPQTEKSCPRVGPSLKKVGPRPKKVGPRVCLRPFRVPRWRSFFWKIMKNQWFLKGLEHFLGTCLSI